MLLNKPKVLFVVMMTHQRHLGGISFFQIFWCALGVTFTPYTLAINANGKTAVSLGKHVYQTSF